ncbi:MAG: signal peptide peptidase SppA [Spirochaetaceae bacterium]
MSGQVQEGFAGSRGSAIRGRLAAALFCALLVAVPAAAQQKSFDLSSVAVADGFASPVINPAAPAFGNAGGVAAVLGYEDDIVGRIGARSAPDISVFANTDVLSYAYRRADGEPLHTGILSLPLFGDFYAGAGLSVPDFSFDDPDTTVGLLARPASMLSLGATGTFPEHGDTAYRFGGAVRPLFFAPEVTDRFTLSADLRYRNDELTAPVIGVGLSPQRGLGLRAAWDTEGNRLHVGASLSYGRTRAGNTTSFEPNSGGPGATAFAHLAAKEFRSLSPIRPRNFAEYRPGPVVAEQPPSTMFSRFETTDPTDTVTEIITDIRRLSRNDSLAGILFRNHNLQASYASILEIKRALEDFKSTGKRVVFYFEQTDALNYALAASVADEIYLNPHGSVMLSGLSRTRPYLKDFLDDLGVEVANLRSGPYKTAGTIFSERDMPAEEREALEALLDDQHRVLTTMIADGRGERLETSPEELVADGPYLVAEDAADAGLVDALTYEDEVEDRLKKLHRGARTARVSARDGIRYEWSRRPAPRVAVIYATGNIVRGDGMPGATIGSETTARAIRQAREDPLIDGIILRVSSGGGSSLASAVIAREIELTTEGEDPKPVVVSMADVAASGGYYISVPADRIVAHPVTVTGSIGVVELLPNIEELSREHGINWETVKTTDRADLGALYRRLSDDERQVVENAVGAQYDRFVSAVAEHRELDKEEVERLAGGRVWSGRAAFEQGLLDELGGLLTSMEVMAELLDTDAELQIIEVYPGRRFLDELRVERWMEAQARARLSPELRTLLELEDELDRYGDEMVLMLAGFEVEKPGR